LAFNVVDPARIEEPSTYKFKGNPNNLSANEIKARVAESK